MIPNFENIKNPTGRDDKPAHIHDSTIISSNVNTLQAILDSAPVAIQIINPAGIFIDCNRKTLEMFGAQTREEIIRQPIGIISPTHQRDGRSSTEVYQEMISQAFSGEVVKFRWDYQKISGEIFPAVVTLNVVQYDERSCLMATVMDQTILVNKINAMSALIKHAPFSVLTISPDIEILDVNPANCAITGQTKEEAKRVGFKGHKVIEREGGSIADALKTKQPVSGKFVCDFGSGVKHLDYTYVPVLNHNREVVQIYHIMADKTELTNRLNEFEVLVEQSPAGILTADVHGGIISTNASFSTISRVPVHTLTSMNLADFNIMSLNGPSFPDVVTSGKAGTGQLTVDFGNGMKILDYSFIPVLDTNHIVNKVILMFIDVTGVHKLVDYLEKSVQVVSGHIEDLALGKTAFTSSVLPGDEYTQSAHDSFVTIHKSLDKARLAINRLVEDSVQMSEASVAGDLSYRADPTRHQGDYSSIVSGMNKTLDCLNIPVQEAMRVSNEYARYNFTARFSHDHEVQGDWIMFRDALDRIGTEVSSVLSNTIGHVHSLAKNTEEASASIEEITQGAGDVTSVVSDIRTKTEQSDANTTQILSAMTDMIDVVSAVATKADLVATLSRETTTHAKQGIELAQNSDHSMLAITQSSKHVEGIISDINNQMNEIGKIVKIISDIASQTNLLALNAAIEAARAGETGRGFAVVASEVKSLAQDSRKSAEAIADLISSLKNKAQSATEAISESGQVVMEGKKSLEQTLQSFTQIAEKIETINSHITEVASASEEQAASVEEITSSIQEIADLTHTIASETVSVSGSSQEISSALSRINQVVTNIVDIVDGVSTEMTRFSV
jgi:PAS domain S-box-containing protein